MMELINIVSNIKLRFAAVFQFEHIDAPNFHKRKLFRALLEIFNKNNFIFLGRDLLSKFVKTHARGL